MYIIALYLIKYVVVWVLPWILLELASMRFKIISFVCDNNLNVQYLVILSTLIAALITHVYRWRADGRVLECRYKLFKFIRKNILIISEKCWGVTFSLNVWVPGFIRLWALILFLVGKSIGVMRWAKF